MKTEQTNTADPQLRQQLDAKSKKFDEAFNNNDAAALAAFFTEDAVLVTDTGPVYATIVNKAFGGSSPADSARARVSTYEQNLQLQVDALKKAGCKRVFTDKEGGTRPERKGLAEALSHLRENDALVVWRLDRLGQNGERAGSGTHSMSRSSISNLHYF
jgi:hypothetical protein